MAGITTAFMNALKRDLFSSLFCFNAVITFTATGTSTTVWTSVSALTGLAVGMVLSGTNVAAGTVIASIDSATQITVSKASTGALGTVTATGDAFKIALIKFGMAGTYGAASTNYTDITGNTDEVVGTGYVAGGTALVNVTPTISTSTGITDFTPDPSWTTATIDAEGCMIYNTTRRGPAATPGSSVHDFGHQTVTAGTFTVVLPVPAAGTAILQIA